MTSSSVANWWQFAVDPQLRRTKITPSSDIAGLHEVNPPSLDGRLSLDYHSYLGLEKLLAAQVPSSMVPDERCFIITHQLFELVFKLMVFDMAVVTKTFMQLLEIPFDGSFHSLCTTSATNSGFWQPALTASARIKYSSRILLPAFIGYLSNTESKDETFNSMEFGSYRDYLPPASGFQTAQFRLIQRALGKENLLSIKLYPAEEYWKHYEAKEDPGPISIIDPIILRQEAGVANPVPESPYALPSELDKYAHHVLERLAKLGDLDQQFSSIPIITQDSVDQAIESFRRLLSGQRSKQEKAGKKPADAEEKDKTAEALFRESLCNAVADENNRRILLKLSRIGAFHLHHISPTSHLAQVLNRLVSADSALHGQQEDSFISLHHDLARKRILDLQTYAKQASEPEPPSGTGGGGVPYLGYVKKYMLPLFPALIAYRDLEDTPIYSWVE